MFFILIIIGLMIGFNFINVLLMFFEWSVDEPLIIINGTVPELFYKKNWFGILLGVIICLLFSPSLIIALVTVGISKIFIFIGYVCEAIWNFGNK